MRFLQGQQFQKLKWRDQRGYMLVDTVRYHQNENQLELLGYLKGKSLNPNQLVHITGYGDFQIKRIDILKNPLKTQHKKKQQTIEIEESQSQNDIILFRESDPLQTESLECLHSECQDLSYLIKQQQAESVQKEEKMMDLEEKKENEIDSEDGSDIEFKESKNDADWDKEQLMEEKKKIKFELRERDQEDYEFEEEAEYPANIILKERFKKYCGLKNFKAEWNIFKNLPEKEFGKIFIYENFQRAQKESREKCNANGFAFPGFYLRVILQNAQILANHTPSSPLILSTLFEHERKVTIVHFKIQLGLEFQDQKVLKSKEAQTIQVGFRRDTVKPIYSELYQNCAKTKYKKEIKGKQFYLASFYYYTLFTPATLILFTPKDAMFPNDKVALASGELHSVNPLHVVLKKKILTGYPQRKKAVVKLMFFNKIDVDYFSPIQLHTKLGLKGKIKESVGTHGLFKSAYNQFIKSHDTICLSLYKRVYPPWISS